ncbi:MAG: helix-turn-helix domain-containing protein [Xanthomonadales bacterium]|nr:helix-turn-helix domain-containing protein [Xanthomonadales bacterium]
MRLGFLLYPGCMPAGLFAAADMVRACNLRHGRECVQASWVGLDLKAVQPEHGPALQPRHSLSNAKFDALLVPGAWIASVEALDPMLLQQKRLIDALRALPGHTQIWSYCAGVAWLAASGRLNGHDATATWWLLPALTERFPRVRWQENDGLTLDARLATASGPNGYLPLMLDRLATRFPGEILQDVQDVLMLPRPRARHTAFDVIDIMSLRDPGLRRLIAFTQRTPAQGVGQVKKNTGIPAGDWLRRIKLSQAAEALRRTHAPIKTISDTLGFADETSLYRAFKGTTGLTPTAYRQAYAE